MARQTQGLKIQQVGRLRVTGKAVNEFDVVHFRGLMRDLCSSVPAAIAVAEQNQRLQVHAPGTLSLKLSSLNFPVNVVQVTPGPRVVRCRRPLLPGHRNVLSAFQHIAFADADEVLPATISTKTLCPADVVTTTQRFDSDPASVIVQLIRNATEVVRDAIVVGPPRDDC